MKYAVLYVVVAALVPACAAETERGERIDDYEGDTLALADGKADAIETTSTYYTFEQDFRRCAFPYCGGMYARRVNFSTTRCVDGTSAARCYVAEVDLSGLELSDEQRSSLWSTPVVLRGTFSVHTESEDLRWTIFHATEAWKAATDDAPIGYTYRVTDNGIRCITTPCVSLHEAKLNSTVSRNLSDLWLDGVGATEEQVSQAYESLSSGGVLVAGFNYTYRTRRGGRGIGLDAWQFYLPVLPSAEPAECEVSECGPALGLANRLCDDGVTVSGPTGRCLARDGGCGWEVISCPE